MTLAAMKRLGFYELLGCEPSAHFRTITRLYGKLAKLYHPDKGGDPITFRYLKMVYDVLKNSATRAEYDRDGRGRWAADFKDDCPPPCTSVPPPPVNEAFLKMLCTTRGATQHYIGDFQLHHYLAKVLERRAVLDVYEECTVASKLCLQLRLVAKGARDYMPVFPQPRVVRYAAFMGMPVIELDVPSSHGQQALKYCRFHGHRKAVLEQAFASTAVVASFRSTLGLTLDVAKYSINMLVGGAGAVKVKSEAGISELPPLLLRLQEELNAMRAHMMEHCPADWKLELKHAKYPLLTLGSWHYQLGERIDLDAVTAKLPESVTVHGWFSPSKCPES